ncbi:hypothetical protein P171DRAFT_489356 [Karstenula rhodostoma CBS 690.94]|uniref:Protein kinase domain-containing protein n=1 Tax=Karstenula rhodostoma CBS 690.94 TaxID=1392251 RepID=A0A9P4U7Z3_9PLEO|nr:hypothetical protein P171DRAFT_489356 [Karstenula rhodostoma CBS 690.94]
MILQGDSRFLPTGVLDKLFNKVTVTRALERHDHDLTVDIASLESFVCSKARKVFAILVWVDCEPLIEQFYRHNFGDEQLPVFLEINEDDIYEAISWRLGKINIDKHPFNCDHWSERDIQSFCDYDQWPFLSPVFNEIQFRYEFHERIRMPFMDEQPRSLEESFFTVVEEWRIHRDHIRTPGLIGLPKNPYEHPPVAVKKPKQMSLTAAEFETVVGTEVQALETIRDLDHRHLAKSVAYYKKGQSLHYFPMGSLGQSQRYLDAMMTLHHSHQGIRLGDLKPENILCFDDADKEQSDDIYSCILVIADIGLSRTHDTFPEFGNDTIPRKSKTDMYEPPETELPNYDPSLYHYNVWSLGCIYLEIMIWLLYGHEEHENFRDDLNSSGESMRLYIVEEDLSSRKWIPVSTVSYKHIIVGRLLIVDVSPARRFLPRRTTTIMKNANTSTTPSVVIRPPSFDDDLSKDSSPSSRATAEELEGELRLIVEDVASTTAEHVEWLDWNASAQQGPRRYGDRLAA